jgi:uncharacterized BrkB/YihY/UPF0761 family membrane protein
MCIQTTNKKNDFISSVMAVITSAAITSGICSVVFSYGASIRFEEYNFGADDYLLWMNISRYFWLFATACIIVVFILLLYCLVRPLPEVK